MAGAEMEIGVRYCGGCNPRYDRVAQVRRLEQQFPRLRFAPVSGQSRAVLVVGGCTVCCATTADLPPVPRLRIRCAEDTAAAAEALRELTAALEP